MYDTEGRKLLSALCHGSVLFSTSFVSVVLPLAILFIINDSVVKSNAKEAINFHLNVWFYGVIITVLIWVTLGLLFPLAAMGFLLHWGLTIWALFCVLIKTEKPFRYPFIFRLL
ncbi:MAG: DUF4870 domain-containing protein [Calothrix sp. MO_167.B12]|nr:DUF4870 domain-containing protein [Calothrix sp. MO_167.B12]